MPAHAQKTQTFAGLSDWRPALIPGASSRARRCYLRKFFGCPKRQGYALSREGRWLQNTRGCSLPRILVWGMSFSSNSLSGGVFCLFDGVGDEDGSARPCGLFAERWARRHCVTAGPSPSSPWAGEGGVGRGRSSRENGAQHSCRVSARFDFICLTEGHPNLGKYCPETSSHNSTSPDGRAASWGL